ncbi:MAG: DUF3089 domain-containing protein [Bacteroidales bacterium]|jgi:hypothetical protein|nr:DUF3089 domain-containing protein [Bacteroidales bacterium]
MKRDIRTLIYPVILLVAIGISIGGCKKSDNLYTVSTSVDYSQATHWLSLPATIYKTDVFYLYPTTSWTKDNSVPMICAIDDSLMMAGAVQAFNRQATAFDTSANVFSPYYRQNNSSPVNRLNVIAGIPTSDATAAFDYYIRHFNQGRPFILAGHSQGANIVCNLLSGYLKANPKVYARMIAAYVIGGPVSKAFLQSNPHLKFATGPDDTGVIISYNTEAADFTGVNPVIYGEVGLVINPITWTRDETLAETTQGLGSLFPDNNGVWGKIPQYADARVDTTKGVLVCTSADEAKIAIIDSLSGFPKGVYHSFDYPFYYYNIRQNAANRASIFLNKKTL